MICSICSNEIRTLGHNAYPYKTGTCCDECNLKHVVPLRFFLTGEVKDCVLIISADGIISYKKIETGELILQTSQEIVGGYIEFYPMKDDKFFFIVDEEGVLKQKKWNPLAFQLFEIKMVGTLLVSPKNLLK